MLRSAPAADRDRIDVEHHADETALVAERHRFADIGIELELVLNIFRREHRSVIEPADVLGAVDDLEVAGLLIKEAGVAGHYVTVRSHHFGGLGIVLEIAREHAG